MGPRCPPPHQFDSLLPLQRTSTETSNSHTFLNFESPTFAFSVQVTHFLQHNINNNNNNSTTIKMARTKESKERLNKWRAQKAAKRATADAASLASFSTLPAPSSATSDTSAVSSISTLSDTSPLTSFSVPPTMSSPEHLASPPAQTNQAAVEFAALQARLNFLSDYLARQRAAESASDSSDSTFALAMEDELDIPCLLACLEADMEAWYLKYGAEYSANGIDSDVTPPVEEKEKELPTPSGVSVPVVSKRTARVTKATARERDSKSPTGAGVGKKVRQPRAKKAVATPKSEATTDPEFVKCFGEFLLCIAQEGYEMPLEESRCAWGEYTQTLAPGPGMQLLGD
ncbi:hypothetical protein BJ508DRAFT_161453 [Ascobolus immersus RN42]|uniref:Uncharacterized protein n=1 Tax=Ascobolus immersus RN42 TaxID=1160509 RepID=A0A3N4HW22_ASCIM|nr:hypothetical protein BJ508DRAFT_161453 [Ascobolus immersus RN42]